MQKSLVGFTCSTQISEESGAWPAIVWGTGVLGTKNVSFRDPEGNEPEHRESKPEAASVASSSHPRTSSRQP